MKRNFKKLMRDQVQATIDDLKNIIQKTPPIHGWIKTLRQVLGISTNQLAKKIGSSQANVSALEQREKNGTISLNKLKEVAQALDCQCVYFLIPNKSFDQMLEDQARRVAKKRLKTLEHSMELEQQGLTVSQKKEEENNLIKILLEGNPRYLWEDEE